MRAFLTTSFAAVALSLALPALALADFTVVNSGFSAWKIDNVNNPVLQLVRGQTYNFNVTATGHAFWIETAPGVGAMNPYNSGVTGNGVTVGTLTFTVPLDAPSPLYYNCEFHAAMEGTISIADPTGVPGPGKNVRLGLVALPNPSKGALQFSCTLPGAGRARIELLDVFGRKLWSGEVAVSGPGTRIVSWNRRTSTGGAAGAGVYLARLTSPWGRITRPVVLLK